MNITYIPRIILLFALVTLCACESNEEKIESKTPDKPSTDTTTKIATQPSSEIQTKAPEKSSNLEEHQESELQENPNLVIDDFVEKQPEEEAPSLEEERYSDVLIAIDEYYFSISKGSCNRAIQIRPAYSLKDCKSDLGRINLLDRSLVNQSESNATVFVSISIQEKNTTVIETAGLFQLKKNIDEWIIEEPFKPASELDVKKLKEKKIHKGEEITPTGIAFQSKIGIFDDIGSTVPKDNSTDYENVAKYSSQAILPSKKINLLGHTTFGSEVALTCWSPKQLHGHPSKDKKVKRPIPADHRPPLYKIPHHHGNPLPKNYQNSIRFVPDPNKKIVALTFDLCERAKEITGYDGAIVNYLRENNIKATFYAGGKWMRSHPEKTKQIMADPLFEIGNHGWTHGNMRVLKGQDMKNQILWTQSQYEILRDDLQQQCTIPETEMQKIPQVPLTFRFPYGTCSTESLNTLANFGLPAVQWNIVTADPARGQTGKAISRTILKQIKPGSIIIAHANGRGHGTDDSLHRFIPKLRKKGYKFVTVSELLASSKQVQATAECYEVRPGDNKRYDRIFGKGTE